MTEKLKKEYLDWLSKVDSGKSLEKGKCIKCEKWKKDITPDDWIGVGLCQDCWNEEADKKHSKFM